MSLFAWETAVFLSKLMSFLLIRVGSSTTSKILWPPCKVPGAIPGVIVFAAHYDSRGVDPLNGSSFAPGANDNASGVAAMLETARVLSSREWSQTIVFVAFAAEEQIGWAARTLSQTAC